MMRMPTNRPRTRIASIRRLADLVAVAACVILVAWSFGDMPGYLSTPATPPAGEAGEAGAPADEQFGEEVEGAGEELKQRQEWFEKRHTDGKGKVPRGAWFRAQREAAALRDPLAVATTPLTWSLVGPRAVDSAVLSWIYGGSTPYSGRVTALATHPTRSEIAYMGAAHGGVWRTADNGATWTEIFGTATSTASIAIGAVAVDPNDPRILFVGTGEANFGSSSYFATGVYRSTNEGASWSKVGGSAFDGCAVSSIVIRRGDSQTVLLGLTNPNTSFSTVGSCHQSGKSGLYRSVNGGTGWTKIFGGNVTKIVAAPNSPDTFYAGVYNGGVYKSTNGGLNWTVLGGGLPASPFGRVEISAVAAGSLSSTQTLYAAIAKPARQGFVGVYRSNDGGLSWTGLGTPNSPPGVPVSTFCGSQCSYDLAVAADPANPGRMFLGGIYLYRFAPTAASIGFGTPTSAVGSTCPLSARTVATSCIHVDVHVLQFDASGRLWVGTDGGVYRVVNTGASPVMFNNLNANLSNIQFYPGIAGSLSAPPIIGGSQDNGSARYGGASNWPLVGWGDGGYAAVTSSSVALVTSQYLSVAKLVNGARCNDNLYYDGTGIAEAGNDKGLVGFIAPLVGSPTNRATVYAGSYRVYRTTNGAAGCGQTTWTRISQDFTYAGCGGLCADQIQAIAPASDNATVYAATSGNCAGGIAGKVYVTRGTTTWTASSSGLPGACRTVTDIWVHPTSAGTAYATIGGFDSDAVSRHLYRTTNFGASWSNVSGSDPATDLPNAPASAVVVDASTSPGTIYVGTDVGVFWSIDGGSTWANTSIGLPRVPVMDLLLDKNPKTLLAATYGRGLWSAPVDGTSGPVNDAFAAARAVAGPPYTDAGVATASATTETGENRDPSCTDFIGKTVWYRYAPTTTSTVIADTIGSEAGFDTVIVAYQGTALGGLTPIGCDDDGAGAGGGASKTAALKVTAGQTYYFQVGGWAETSISTPDSGSLTFHLTVGGPVNDDFGNAAVVGGLPYTATPVSNATATNQTGEDRDPSCADFVGRTVWYRYVPASTVTVTADTLGSSMDTVLVAFQGTTLAGLTEVGCDDDGGGAGGPSRIGSLTLTGGQSYFFQVGSWIQTLDGVPATGTVNFRITTAGSSSDMFAGAIAIGALPYTDAGRSTVNATTEAGEDVDPSCTDFTGKTVWYRYVAGSSGNLTADTLGSSFDTVLVVYRGTTLAGLVEHACDDDGGGVSGGPSKITTFPVTAGQTYYFQVGGWRSSVGTPVAGSVTFHLATAP